MFPSSASSSSTKDFKYSAAFRKLTPLGLSRSWNFWWIPSFENCPHIKHHKFAWLSGRSWTWLRHCHWSLKLIQKEHSGERSLQKLAKKGVYQKEEGMTDFFIVLNTIDITTLHSCTKLGNPLSYYIFSSLITISVH